MLELILGLVGAGLIIWATCSLMRNRSTARRIGKQAAKEAEEINVMSNDTRRAFWYSSADTGSHGDSSGGGGGGGDE